MDLIFRLPNNMVSIRQGLYSILLRVHDNDLLIWDISHYPDNTVGYLAKCRTFQYQKKYT